MKLKIEIDLDNAVFNEDWCAVTTRLLHTLAEQSICWNTADVFLTKDINGNTVSTVTLVEE